MPTDTRRPALPVSSGTARGARPRRRDRPRRAGRRTLPNPLAAVVLTLFLLFFVVPVLWLVLAATKTDGQLVQSNPLAFGSWHALRVNWDKLTAYQSDAIFLWLRNSAVYSFGALIITLCVAIPAGYALAMTEFRAGARCWWPPSSSCSCRTPRWWCRSSWKSTRST